MKYGVLLVLFFLTTPLQAELDPALRDLSVEAKNPEGLFVKGLAEFGQSNLASDRNDSRPGVAYAYGAELGYAIASGYWKRVEIGLGLTQGEMKFRSKMPGTESAKATISVPMATMLRFGMGHVMGQGGMLLWNVGLGAYMTDYEANSASTGTAQSTSSNLGFAWRIGASFLMPASEYLQFEVGAQYTRVSLEVDEVKTGSTKVSANISEAINVPQLLLGLRFQL